MNYLNGGFLMGPICFASSILLSHVSKRGMMRRSVLSSYMNRGLPPVAKTLEDAICFGINEKNANEYRGNFPMNPPKTRRDQYNWLRDETRKNDEVLSYLAAENKYCADQMMPLKNFEDTLYDEMISHIKETDEEVPYKYGNYFYYDRTEKGKSYKIHCRRSISDVSSEEIVFLDENKVAAGRDYCIIGRISVSPSHSMVAYAVDYSGYETYTIRIISNVATGEELTDTIEGSDGQIYWGNDDSCFFYFTMDDEHRPCKLLLHVIGTPQLNDVCVLSEMDPKFWMDACKSADDKYLLIGTASKETSEQYVINLQGLHGGAAHVKGVAPFDGDLPGGGTLQCVQRRKFGVRFEEFEHNAGRFYLITNADDCKNGKLVSCIVDDVYSVNGASDTSKWTVVKSYQADQQLESFLPFKNHFVLTGRSEGLPKIWLSTAGSHTTSSSALKWIEMSFPESVYDAYLGANYDYNSDKLRIVYTSLLTPKQTIDYDMYGVNPPTILKEQEVPGYNRNNYQSMRLFAPAFDGSTQIPMSMVYSKVAMQQKRTQTGSAMTPSPLLLYGYGSYGACIDPVFDTKRQSMLDRGVIYVIAHIRGGGEMGRAWYEDEGKYLTKRNTFDDFAACATHLIAAGLTSPSQMACVGRSAGGLLIGAMCNMYPQLFKAAVADVPFVDVLNTMSDPTIPLTVTEWEEWGNPNEEQFHDYMLSYSPYDNVKPLDATAPFPALLVTAGLNDPRVPYWEPAKWVAKMRAGRSADRIASPPLLLKTDLSAGHFSSSDRYKYTRESAFEYAFILDQLGAKELV